MHSKSDHQRKLWPVVAATLIFAGSAAPAAAKVSATLHTNTANSTWTGAIDGGEFLDVSQAEPSGVFRGVTIEALSRLTTSEILFKNSVIGAGLGTRVSATIGVEVTVENIYGRAFTPVLKTKLLAAGMGMFLGTSQFNRFYNHEFDNPTETLNFESDGPSALACNIGQLKNCSVLSDAALASENSNTGLPGTNVFGTSEVGFIFDVTVGGIEAYRLTSTLSTDPSGAFSQTFSNDYGAADTVLNDFRRVTAAGDGYSSAFKWDDTEVDIRFPSLLEVGQSVTAVYTITTFVNIGDDAGGRGFTRYEEGPGYNLPVENNAFTPVGFAAFADPIGNNSSIDDFSAFRSFSLTAAGATGGINTNGTGILDIANIGFDEDTGEIRLNAFTESPPADFQPYGPFVPPGGGGGGGGGPDVVPEPSTWAMLIMGFGFVGAALRRRKAIIA